MAENEQKHPKLRVDNVWKSFGSNQVLRGVSLDVMPGESAVVIGGSGSGKSVLLKCIIGLISPDSGHVYLDGTDITNPSEETRARIMNRFGMLFQGSALFDSLKVWENVSFALMKSRKMKPQEARKKAEEKLQAVGLEPSVADLYPAELSGGMQKRVALARAIATDPEIIFFDEPTTGLDPIMSDVINDLIVKCVRDLGATAVTITHDMASARKISDRIAMIYEGQIVWHGDTGALDESGNSYVEQFIHGSAEGPIRSARAASAAAG